MFYRHSIIFENQIEDIDELLSQPDSIEDKDLPYIFHFLDILLDGYTSESIYYSEQLNVNPDDNEQKELTKEILKYINAVENHKYQLDPRMTKAVREIDIAIPKVNLEDINGNWDRSDSSYYSNIDLGNAHKLVRSHKFRSILKTLRTYKIWNMADSRNLNSDGLSIRSLIKDYYPEVKMFYKDVGIIGTSLDGFDDVGGVSTPLILTNEDENIWEIKLYLKKGKVKFRCRDSWAQNWGNDDFPKGIGRQNGEDIPVNEAGNYHIIFKPVTGEYEFIKLED